MTRRIGLLGGTFNPIHLGHLVLAEEARERLRLDEVWFIPVAEPPMKDDPELAPAADRLEMVRRAIIGHPAFRASDIEIRRGGKSYTIDTLRELRRCYGTRCEFVFIVGSDACRQLAAWKGYPALLRCCRFVIAHRLGFRPTRLPQGVRALDIPALDISATDIRRRIAHGRSIRHLVPERVRSYIAARRLYAVHGAGYMVHGTAKNKSKTRSC